MYRFFFLLIVLLSVHTAGAQKSSTPAPVLHSYAAPFYAAYPNKTTIRFYQATGENHLYRILPSSRIVSISDVTGREYLPLHAAEMKKVRRKPEPNRLSVAYSPYDPPIYEGLLYFPERSNFDLGGELLWNKRLSTPRVKVDTTSENGFVFATDLAVQPKRDAVCLRIAGELDYEETIGATLKTVTVAAERLVTSPSGVITADLEGQTVSFKDSTAAEDTYTIIRMAGHRILHAKAVKTNGKNFYMAGRTQTIVFGNRGEMYRYNEDTIPAYEITYAKTRIERRPFEITVEPGFGTGCLTEPLFISTGSKTIIRTTRFGVETHAPNPEFGRTFVQLKVEDPSYGTVVVYPETAITSIEDGCGRDLISAHRTVVDSLEVLRAADAKRGKYYNNPLSHEVMRSAGKKQLNFNDGRSAGSNRYLLDLDFRALACSPSLLIEGLLVTGVLTEDSLRAAIIPTASIDFSLKDQQVVVSGGDTLRLRYEKMKDHMILSTSFKGGEVFGTTSRFQTNHFNNRLDRRDRRAFISNTFRYSNWAAESFPDGIYVVYAPTRKVSQKFVVEVGLGGVIRRQTTDW